MGVKFSISDLVHSYSPLVKDEGILLYPLSMALVGPTSLCLGLLRLLQATKVRFVSSIHYQSGLCWFQDSLLWSVLFATKLQSYKATKVLFVSSTLYQRDHVVPQTNCLDCLAYFAMLDAFNGTRHQSGFFPLLYENSLSLPA